MSLFRDFYLLAAALLVQGFMLFQVGITFVLLRWRNRNHPLPEGLSPLEPDRKNEILSIIIPAFNEAQSIESTLRRINLVAARPESIEVIVVDAGGSDGTMSVAAEVVAELRSAGSKLLFNLNVKNTLGFGRGPTLSSGVFASTGSILLFLHADTQLPWLFDTAVRSRLKDDRVLATAFRFRVAREEAHGHEIVPGLGVMEATVYIRSKYYQLPFGDQAMAMTRQRFQAVGGFPANAPIMEDFELVAKLRRINAGSSGKYFIDTLDAAAECSSRRWASMTVWRANLTNQVIMIAYVYAGYSPKQIYDLYYKSGLSQLLRGFLQKIPFATLLFPSVPKGE